MSNQNRDEELKNKNKEFQTELFPPKKQDPDKSWNDPECDASTDPGDANFIFDAEEFDKILDQVCVEDVADTVTETYRNVANKWMFELLMYLINPTTDNRREIIHQLATIGAKIVQKDVEENLEQLPPEARESEAELIKEGVEVGQARFIEEYNEEILREEFLELCRQAVRKNLSR